MAAGGIIDERVMTVPPGVAGVKYISLNEICCSVAVSVAGAVIGEGVVVLLRYRFFS
jgi:hypothetical protein